MSKLTFDQKLRLLNAEHQQKYYEEQTKEWKETPCTIDLPQRYWNAALAFTSPNAMGVTYDYFIWATSPQEQPKEYNIYDAVLLAQNCDRTFAQFCMIYGGGTGVYEKYNEFLKFAEQLTIYVNGICEPISERLLRKYKTLQDLAVKNGRTPPIA